MLCMFADTSLLFNIYTASKKSYIPTFLVFMEWKNNTASRNNKSEKLFVLFKKVYRHIHIGKIEVKIIVKIRSLVGIFGIIFKVLKKDKKKWKNTVAEMPLNYSKYI